MATATVEMSLHLSQETSDFIEELCEDNHLSKSDLFRKSLALMTVVLKYKKMGGHLVVLDSDDQKISEIVGL